MLTCTALADGVKMVHNWGCWRFNSINSLRPRRNENFANDIFKHIFFNENVWISIKISLKFVPKGPINNIPALIQIMAWRRSVDKPLSEPMMVTLPTHICVTLPQCVNSLGDVAVFSYILFSNTCNDWYLEHFLWNCPQLNANELHWGKVNIG